MNDTVREMLRRELESRYGGRRILVADDDPVQREIVTELLCAADLQVTVATDGHEAIALAATHQPHVILMDVNMPRLGGRAATAWLRSELQLGVPIIAMTDATDAEELAACLVGSMNDVLPKPAQHAAFYACLLQWLSAPDGRAD